jgi:hypothetical protein
VLTMMQSLDEDCQKELRTLDYKPGLESKASRIPVSLEREAEGWRLVRSTQLRHRNYPL